MKRALVLIVAILAAIPAAGSCLECRESPNGWGNCRPADSDGYTHCQRIVIDQFSGKTGCDTWETCVAVGDGGFDDCWWTDINGDCVYYY